MAVPFCQTSPAIPQCFSQSVDRHFNCPSTAYYYIVCPANTTPLLPHDDPASRLCGPMINDHPSPSSCQDSGLGSGDEELCTNATTTDADSVTSASGTPDCDEKGASKIVDEASPESGEEEDDGNDEQTCSDGGLGNQPSEKSDEGKGSAVNSEMPYSFLENSGYFHNLNARTKKIFVGGLSASTREEDIKEYFSSFGEVNECTLMIDRQTNRHRGFAFVTFQSEEVVEEVCSRQFHEIKSKMVEAKKAEPREVFFPKASTHGFGNRPPQPSVAAHPVGPLPPRGSWKGSFFNPASIPSTFPPFPGGPLPPPMVMPFQPFPPAGPHVYPPNSLPFPPAMASWFLPFPQFPFPPSPGLPFGGPPFPVSPPTQTTVQGGVPFTMYKGTAYFSLPNPKYIQ